MFRYLLSLGWDWDFYINLSEADFPVMPLDDLELCENDPSFKLAPFPPVFARKLCWIALSPFAMGFAAICHPPLGGIQR